MKKKIPAHICETDFKDKQYLRKHIESQAWLKVLKATNAIF